jgi:hypothetical protein
MFFAWGWWAQKGLEIAAFHQAPIDFTGFQNSTSGSSHPANRLELLPMAFPTSHLSIPSRESACTDMGASSGPMRLAGVEAQKISERTRAGMSRAKAKGIKIGRPKLPAELRHEITSRAAKGETAYAIAKALQIDRHTAAKYWQP